MTVRQATREDGPRVLELARLFFSLSDIFRAFTPPPGQLEALLELVLEHGVILVAEAENQVVGFIALAAVPHPFTGTFYAEELAWFVHPDNRAGTAGPRLLGAAEEWTRQRGLFALKMGAPADEPDVARFYARRGYQAVETAYVKRF